MNNKFFIEQVKFILLLNSGIILTYNTFTMSEVISSKLKNYFNYIDS